MLRGQNKLGTKMFVGQKYNGTKMFVDHKYYGTKICWGQKNVGTKMFRVKNVQGPTTECVLYGEARNLLGVQDIQSPSQSRNGVKAQRLEQQPKEVESV